MCTRCKRGQRGGQGTEASSDDGAKSRGRHLRRGNPCEEPCAEEGVEWDGEATESTGADVDNNEPKAHKPQSTESGQKTGDRADHPQVTMFLRKDHLASGPARNKLGEYLPRRNLWLLGWRRLVTARRRRN